MDTREALWSQALLAERRGDAVAYEAFLLDFAAILRRTLGWKGLGPGEVEDVVQEVLIAVHAKRRQWDAVRPLLPWLNAIVRYKTIDALRCLGRQRHGRVELTDEDWANLPTEAAPEPVDVERLLAVLPPAQQAAVRMVALEGATHREAAERLGTTEGAMRITFHRALKKLTAAWRQEDRT